MTVDTSRFHKRFREHPNFGSIVDEINKSPHLVELINAFPGKIELGKPESGGFYQYHADPAKRVISIGSDEVDLITNSSGLVDQDYLGRFVAGLGHEAGHAVVPGGYTQTNGQMTTRQAVDADMENEGIAILTEYRVAKELNKPMWSGGYSFRRSLDAALSKYNGNINSPDFEKEAIQIGANYYRTANPSGTPNLTYEQYYSAWHVLQYGQHNLTGAQIRRIDWKNITPEQVALKPEVAGQKPEFVDPQRLLLDPQQLPLKPPSAETVVGNLLQQGLVRAEQVLAWFGKQFKTIVEGLRNASVGITEHAQAPLNGNDHGRQPVMHYPDYLVGQLEKTTSLYEKKLQELRESDNPANVRKDIDKTLDKWLSQYDRAQEVLLNTENTANTDFAALCGRLDASCEQMRNYTANVSPLGREKPHIETLNEGIQRATEKNTENVVETTLGMG